MWGRESGFPAVRPEFQVAGARPGACPDGEATGEILEPVRAAAQRGVYDLASVYGSTDAFELVEGK